MKEDSIEEALKKLSTGKKIKMYELLRTFKKEGIENFVITRKKYVDVILSDYKRVLKENEELNLKYYMLYTGKIENLKAQEVKIKSQVIPVQKVKDKIEEILNNGEYRIIFEGDAEFPDKATRIDAQKYIKLEKLQELLEGRKENV